MNNWVTWLGVIGSTTISLLALVLTFVKYAKHEKRLNKQQMTLNEQQEKLNEQQEMLNEQQKTLNTYQINKIKEEELAARKAVIKGDITRDTKDSIRLIVSNVGQVSATNVHVEITGSTYGLLMEDLEDIELLNPQKLHKYSIYLTEDHVKTVNVKYSWSDAFRKDNECVESLQIP
jgi:hypothetical protein